MAYFAPATFADIAPLQISSIGPFSLGVEIAVYSPATTAPTWSNGNRAIYIPFRVPEKITVIGINLQIVTSSGNLDVGIYNADLTKVASKGSTAMPVAGAAQIALAATLSAGRYYMALAVDNTVAAIRSMAAVAGQGAIGFFYQNGGFPLPAPAVVSNAAAVDIPVMAVALTANIGGS